MRTFYEILGVSRDATRHEIRDAFLRLAQAYHPDLHGECLEADRQFKQIRRVYEVLIDPEKRHLYDQKPFLFPLGSEATWGSTAPIVTRPSGRHPRPEFSLRGRSDHANRWHPIQRVAMALALTVGVVVFVFIVVDRATWHDRQPKAVDGAYGKVSTEQPTIPDTIPQQDADSSRQAVTPRSKPEADANPQVGIDLRRGLTPHVLDGQFLATDPSFDIAFSQELVAPVGIAAVDDESLTGAPIPLLTTEPEGPHIVLPQQDLPSLPTGDTWSLPNSAAPLRPLRTPIPTPNRIGPIDSSFAPNVTFTPTHSAESVAREFVRRFNQQNSVFSKPNTSIEQPYASVPMQAPRSSYSTSPVLSTDGLPSTGKYSPFAPPTPPLAPSVEHKHKPHRPFNPMIDSSYP